MAFGIPVLHLFASFFSFLFFPRTGGVRGLYLLSHAHGVRGNEGLERSTVRVLFPMVARNRFSLFFRSRKCRMDGQSRIAGNEGEWGGRWGGGREMFLEPVEPVIQRLPAEG